MFISNIVSRVAGLALPVAAAPALREQISAPLQVFCLNKRSVLARRKARRRLGERVSLRYR